MLFLFYKIIFNIVLYIQLILKGKIHIKYFIVLFLAIILIENINAQNDSSSVVQINKKQLNGVIITESFLYTSTMTGLYFLWYADYPQSSFHFFNDNNEWLLMDKVGHVSTAYHISKIGYDLLRWPGVSKKKSILYGSTIGFFYLSTVEILDGFSSEWGASTGDIIANTLGSVAFIGQQLAWDEQRLSLKFSFHKSDYSKYRPNVLGSNFQERMLKDYNGQTYWLSANIHSFLGKDSKWPKCLNIALGYGAEGMIGAITNPSEVNGETIPDFTRYNQYFLTFDIDLTRIETKSKALNMFLDVFGFVKIPFPTLEYNSKNEFEFYWLYF